MDGTIEFPLLSAGDIVRDAWAAFGRGEAEESLRLWRELREQFPDIPDGHIWPVSVLWQSGRVDEAEIAAAAAFARFPEHPELLVQYAWIAMERKRWDEALKWWARVRAHSPDRVDGYIWAARALWQADRLDEAEALAQQAVERFPDDPGALTEAAWVAAARRDWPEALRRWLSVHAAHPEREDALIGTIQALRLTGRLDEAEVKASEAVARLPDNLDLAVEHVWAAVARHDWDAVAARVEAARAKMDDPARFEESFGWVEHQAQYRAAAPEAAPSEPVAKLAEGPAPASDVSITELMLSFESLGERCDFGAVQRKYGVEPLGLLRFAYSRADALITALEDRFVAVGTDEDTSFEDYNGENILYMRKYELIFHTFVYQSELSTEEKRAAFRRQQQRRLGFLRDKLVADLEDGQKTFVYATEEPAADADARRLFRAVRRYGPGRLLYVRPARPDRPAGTVEALEDGLYLGYYPGLNDFVGGGQPPFELWRNLCEQTHRLMKHRAAVQGQLFDANR